MTVALSSITFGCAAARCSAREAPDCESPNASAMAVKAGQTVQEDVRSLNFADANIEGVAHVRTLRAESHRARRRQGTLSRHSSSRRTRLCRPPTVVVHLLPRCRPRQQAIDCG